MAVIIASWLVDPRQQEVAVPSGPLGKLPVVKIYPTTLQNILLDPFSNKPLLVLPCESQILYVEKYLS